MIPPLIGWTAAGGYLLSPRLWLLMSLLGLWQPPHAWLILLANADEVRDSGARTILSSFTDLQLTRILFVWVSCFTAMLVLLPFYGILQHPVLAVTLSLSGALTGLFYAWGLFAGRTPKNYQKLFTLLNSVLVLALLYCIFDNAFMTAIF